MSAPQTAHAEPVEARVTRIIADHLMVSIERDGLTADSHLASDLAADSLDQVELALAMEDEFDIAVSDDQCEACETIGDWQRLVVHLVEAKR